MFFLVRYFRNSSRPTHVVEILVATPRFVTNAKVSSTTTTAITPFSFILPRHVSLVALAIHERRTHTHKHKRVKTEYTCC